ncbi:MAG: DegT/DnrJ/EryC1/StrS family aminotransferase [Gemmatimonadaceae bacterium]|nr:DegT/DnrJ/EryC1/StrS family aminotransferase [Gemmatimonadaceae bacterium]
MTDARPASPNVPFYDLGRLHASIRGELDQALARVLDRGTFVLGEEVERFEAEFARVTGTRHCVTVGNGLDAITLALRALGIGPGDEVIVPGWAFIATWLAGTAVGARVVPVDVDATAYTIDPGAVRAAITGRTRAILPVHLYGHPAPMAALRALATRFRLALVEDAAHAHGAAIGGRPVGSFGDAAAWSFYPGRNLGALGDGGAITTNDAQLAARVRSLRNYGSAMKYVHDELGVHSRLDALQAAVLRTKLPHLPIWNAARRSIVQRYRAAFDGTELILPVAADNITHAWHLFVVRCDARDGVRDALARCGIECLVHYPIPPHRQLAWAGTSLERLELPVTERLSETVLSLPLSPTMTASDVDRVIDGVLSVVGHYAHA